MKKFVISRVGRSTSQKLIRDHLSSLAHVVRKHPYGDHIVFESAMKEHVKAAYYTLTAAGPVQEVLNEFLGDRMVLRHFFVPKINSLVIEEMVPHPGRLYDTVVHCIGLDTGEASRVDLGGYRVKGVRANTSELVVQLEQPDSSGWEWALFDLLSGERRTVCSGGDEFYLSADGNLFFPVDGSSRIGLVDLNTGQLLDTKNKRHFSRYATKVKMLRVIHFDPGRPGLFLLLMKRQDLSFTSLKDEVCIELSVTD